MSIVEHEVLEVYEVQEGALQECMMFVKKLSETSLRDLESDRNNLNDLLKEAEKEVTTLKTSLKTANSNVEELTATVKLDKEQRQNLEDLLSTANARADELKTELKQSRESASALQKLNQEKSVTLMEVDETVEKLTAEKDSLEEELENLKRLRSQDEQETNAIHQLLLKEQEKTFRMEEQRGEVVAQLNKELIEAKKNLSSQKNQADVEIAQLRQKLDLEQRMNESLSNEADVCVNDIKKQLLKVTRENADMQASKEKVLDRLNTAEEEILSLQRKLREEKQTREKLYQDNKIDADEAKSHLEKLKTENDCLTSEKEAIENRLRSLKVENKELLCRATVLQESMEATQREAVLLQEELEAFKTSHTMQDEETKESVESWANRVDDAEDWQQKYRELEIEQETLYSQFTQVRKHRNRVLRENGGLRRQMSMAGAQLAITNQKFQRQLQHFRTQLNMAEHLYREKMLECSILEVQLKHLLKSSPSTPQTYDYPGNSEDHTRDYVTRSIEFSRRYDYSTSRSGQRSRDDTTRHMQQARPQYASKSRVPPTTQKAEQDNSPECVPNDLT